MFQRGYVRFQTVILGLQVANRGQNVIELVQLLQDGAAAILQLLQPVVQSVDHFRSSARRDNLSGSIAHRQDDPAVDETPFLACIGNFRGALALPADRDLARASAVLREEISNRVSSRQCELLVVGYRAYVIGMPFHFDSVVPMLLQQLSQAQQRRITIGEDG